MPSPTDYFLEQREAVAATMRRLYARGLTTTAGGNVSLRLPGERCAITPGGGDKSVLRADQVAVLSLAGDNLLPTCKPSSEFRMHLAIYRALPRVAAIVHGHPPTATAFTAAETPIATDLTAEGHAVLRRVVRVPYAVTGSDALAKLIAEHARDAECLLLANHGCTTLGASLEEAFVRIETLEAAAWQTWIARGLDGVRPLTAAQRAELDRLPGTGPPRDSNAS